MDVSGFSDGNVVLRRCGHATTCKMDAYKLNFFEAYLTIITD